MDESLKVLESEAVKALGGGDVVRQAARRAAEEKVVTVILKEVGSDVEAQETVEEAETEEHVDTEVEEVEEVEEVVRAADIKEVEMPAMFNVSTSSGLSPDGSSRESRESKRSVRPSVFSFDNAHPAFAAAHFLRTKEQNEILRRSVEGVLLSPGPKKRKAKKKKRQQNSLRSKSMNDIDFRAQKDFERRKRGKKIKDLERDADEVSEAQECLTPNRTSSAGEQASTSRSVEEEWQTIKRLESKILQMQSGIDVLKKSEDFKDFWQEVTAPVSPDATTSIARSEDMSERTVSFADEPSTFSSPYRGKIVIPRMLRSEDSAAESDTNFEASSPEIDLKGKKKKVFDQQFAYDNSSPGPKIGRNEKIQEKLSRSVKSRPVSAPPRPPSSSFSSLRESSMPADDSALPPKEDEWKPILTRPKPFSFLDRDAKKSKVKPISTVKMEQDLLIKQADEEGKKKLVFKAKKIPKSVLEARYSNMIKEQETMRIMKHEAHKKKLVDMEKPFAFYLVDKKRQEIKQKKIRQAQESKIKVKPFRANTVPASTYEPRYELLKMEETRRSVKIEERANKLLSESKMPPRMDVESNNFSPIPRAKASKILKSPVKKIARNGHIPDYKKLHQEFEERLAHAKAKNFLKRTVVKEFHLGGSTKEEAEANQKRMEKRLKSILNDIEDDANHLKELRWPYMSTRAKVKPTKPDFDKKSTFKVGDTLAVRLRAAELQKAKERGQYDTREEKEARGERHRAKEARRRRKAWDKLSKMHKMAMAANLMMENAGVEPEPFDAEVAKEEAFDVPPSVEDKSYSETSHQHVIARHKQVAKRAQEMVEKALLAQGVDAYNFVMDPPMS